MLGRLLRLAATFGALTLGLSACAQAAPDAETPSSATDGPPAITGTTEVSEPPLALATIDSAGRVRQLDLLDETSSDLGAVPPPSRVSTDGRYLFADDGEGVSVVDTGRWTWDHLDHFHYYVAAPRLLGRVAGGGAATVATTLSSTTGGTGVFFAGSGEAVLLDTRALSEGEIVERFRLEVEAHAGMLVPIGSFALLTRAERGTVASVVVVDESGMPVPGAEAACRDARGTITTRVGALIGCADGALLATVADGAVVLEHIPYPDGAPAPRATAFAARDGRPTVAAVADDVGIWLLDTRRRAWTLLPVAVPVLQATAVDDDAMHVLALAGDGRVLVIDGSSGQVLAHTDPLVLETISAGAASPTLITDQQRAYLSAPVERRLYEIDFADAARISRVFETPTAPAFLAETGR